MEFEERTIKIVIDTTKCPSCESKACVEACKVCSRGILQLVDGIPSVSHLSAAELQRMGTECLACEFQCQQNGEDAIRIDIPIKGLDEYVAKHQVK